jgi:hypothetical protein
MRILENHWHDHCNGEKLASMRVPGQLECNPGLLGFTKLQWLVVQQNNGFTLINPTNETLYRRAIPIRCILAPDHIKRTINELTPITQKVNVCMCIQITGQFICVVIPSHRPYAMLGSQQIELLIHILMCYGTKRHITEISRKENDVGSLLIHQIYEFTPPLFVNEKSEVNITHEKYMKCLSLLWNTGRDYLSVSDPRALKIEKADEKSDDNCNQASQHPPPPKWQQIVQRELSSKVD